MLMEHKQEILQDVDAGVLADVSSFVQETSPQTYGLPRSELKLQL